MTTIVHALTPVAKNEQLRTRSDNSIYGPDTTSWPPASFTSTDPYATTVGRVMQWDDDTLDDRGGFIVRRGAVYFDVAQAFTQYTRVTGQPAPSAWKITRASLSFMYNSLGMSWEANGEVGSVARYGSQLNRLFYTTTQVPFSPTRAIPMAVVPPFDPRSTRTPTTVSTSKFDYLPVEPKPTAATGKPRIAVPLVFVTKPGGYILTAGGNAAVDGDYRIDLTGKLGTVSKFGVVLAGSPAGESTADPDMDVIDFGAAVYYNFFLNVKIEF
jgi:hypothetical protein